MNMTKKLRVSFDVTVKFDSNDLDTPEEILAVAKDIMSGVDVREIQKLKASLASQSQGTEEYEDTRLDLFEAIKAQSLSYQGVKIAIEGGAEGLAEFTLSHRLREALKAFAEELVDDASDEARIKVSPAKIQIIK